MSSLSERHPMGAISHVRIRDVDARQGHALSNSHLELCVLLGGDRWRIILASSAS